MGHKKKRTSTKEPFTHAATNNFHGISSCRSTDFNSLICTELETGLQQDFHSQGVNRSFDYSPAPLQTMSASRFHHCIGNTCRHNAVYCVPGRQTRACGARHAITFLLGPKVRHTLPRGSDKNACVPYESQLPAM